MFRATERSRRTAAEVRSEEDCVGCRLCYNVCPVENCISMVEIASGRDAVTWMNLQTKPEITSDWEAMKRYRKEKGIEIH